MAQYGEADSTGSYRLKVPNWYVITGGPSSGKTTVIHGLKSRGYTVFEEAARLVIDEGIATGKTIQEIRKDEKKFQQTVLQRKIKTEFSHDKSTLSFFDRGMHDTLAYYRFYNWEIPPKITEVMQHATYKKVFLLDPLPFFEQDYARTEDQNFAKVLTRLLHTAYHENGVGVIKVPVLSPKKRLQFILNHIDNSVGG